MYSVVSGSTRGIGFKLVEELSVRPNAIVFAGFRGDLGANTELAQLVKKLPEVVFPVKLTASDKEDNEAAARYIEDRVGKVDVIFANAGQFRRLFICTL